MIDNATTRVPSPIEAGPLTLDFRQPMLMGIINTTPDSFSDGGRFNCDQGINSRTAVSHGKALVAAGAQILDIGGESTRPGAAPVDAAVEIDRVIPVIVGLASANLHVAISVDTSKAVVARAALEAGAHIVNDVSALGDPLMGAVVAKHNAALVVMHMRGDPRTMQKGEIIYDDVVADVRAALGDAIDRAVMAGVPRKRILIDPGIGFGKTVAHNLTLTRHLNELASLGCAIVYGPSRKSFLGAITGHKVDDRDRATAAACALAVAAGAHVLRVHDVGATLDAISIAAAMRDAP